MKTFLTFIRKHALLGSIISVLIVLAIGHVWYFNQLNNEFGDLNRQQSSLEETILLEAGIPREQHSFTSRAPLIQQSPRALAHSAVLSRQQRVMRRLDILILAAIFGWPTIILGAAFWIGVRFWEGKGVEPSALKNRQNRMRVFGTVSTGLVLTAFIISWRFTASNLSREFSSLTISLAQAMLVAMTAMLFVRVLWGLLQSPVSKLSSRLKSISPIYLVSLQMAVFAVIAFATASDLTDLRNDLRFGRSSIILIVQSLAWIGTVASIGTAMLGYLRLPEKSVSGNPESGRIGLSKPSEVISQDDSEIRALRERVEALIELNTVSHNTDSLDAREAPSALVRQRSQLTRERLLTEVRSLTNRGSLNLMIGSLTSLIAATILWMLVAQAPAGTLGSAALVGYYIPRISVAVFIEVFSFFFLRLYRNGLAAIMYYQNELTNLESRSLALEMAALMPVEGTLPQLLQNLSRTDRNLVLKAGETTVELEKIKVEQENLHSLLGSMLSKVADLTDSVRK